MRFNWAFLRRSAYMTPAPASGGARRWGIAVGTAFGVLLLALLALGWWWNDEPDTFDPVAAAAERAAQANLRPAVGYTTASTVVALADVLLDKRGGYLSNDLAPPGVVLDNIPNWEFGVLVHLRDMSRALRNDFSRAQSQSAEDADLVAAQGHFFYDHGSWIFPASEDEYRSGARRIAAYAAKLSRPVAAGEGPGQGASAGMGGAQVYARADNLARWLDEVERRLGDISQRLSLSVGKRQLDLGLAGDPAAEAQSAGSRDAEARTGWLLIDDIFFEARGQTWALIHLLKAVEHDFGAVLDDKNARVSLRQIIRELEATQMPLRSPMVLNGSGFGPLANHSLVMASYISRVNAALIDLRDLLDRG